MSSVVNCMVVASLIGITASVPQRNGSSYFDVVCIGNNKFEFMADIFNCAYYRDGSTICNELPKEDKEKCVRCCQQKPDDVMTNKSRTKGPSGTPVFTPKNATTKRIFQRGPLQEQLFLRYIPAMALSGTILLCIIAGIWIWKLMSTNQSESWTSRNNIPVTVPLQDTSENNNFSETRFVGIQQPTIDNGS